MINRLVFLLTTALLALLLSGCGSAPVKKYYVLNYVPEPLSQRLNPAPYPVTVRIKEFSIEKAYDQQQIVYRTSAYELGRYFYRVWAVNPTDMFADLIQKHMDEVDLVSHVVRRLDEGAKPDFELNGMIEAIEQYESDEKWFAHLAFRLSLTRLKDNRVVYSRRFDNHKEVLQHDPVQVVSDLSRIMDMLMNQALHDIDVVLARECGVNNPSAEARISSPDSPTSQEGAVSGQ
jgi:ABC-type uncharacterized transport system auxiliary subunit